MVKQAIFRQPRFEIIFKTETSNYHIMHDTTRVNNKFGTESIINLTARNDLGLDSSAFSFVLAGDTTWENILSTNDLIIIKVYSNESTLGSPDKTDDNYNNLIVVGLVSEVRLEGTYDDNRKLYRITGQSFQKAFMQFELRTIQQVSLTLPTTGWMDADLPNISTQTVSGGTGNSNTSNTGDGSKPINPVDNVNITSRFGSRLDPISGASSTHNGLDFGAPTGTPVKAIMPGTVSDSGLNDSAGNYVIIEQTDGYFSSYYHLSSINVTGGQSVSQGQVIGAVGTTGYSTGPHLHLEIGTKPWAKTTGGQVFDPEDYLGGALSAIGTGSTGSTGTATYTEYGAFTQGLVGKTVKDVIGTMLDRFMDEEIMQYRFQGFGEEPENLQDRFEVVQLESWVEDEHLMNPIPFTGFEGSFNQLLIDILTRPFNEMYFDVGYDINNREMSELHVRRTPFDEADWKALPRHTVEPNQVLDETVSQTDLDSYSLYNVIPEDLSDNMALTSARPYFSSDLVKKYGYKMLEVSHKFLGFKPNPQPTTASGGTGAQPSYGSGEEREAFERISQDLGLSTAEMNGWASIIERESGWDMYAENPSSGALGLAQINYIYGGQTLPSDYRHNAYAQLSWMHTYMTSRYGGIMEAKAFWDANNWY